MSINKRFRIKAKRRATERFTNQEAVADVLASSDFSVATFDINPGLVKTFPWLSSVAAKWDQYRFTRFRVHYVPRTATSADGSVVISPEYNALDNIPTTMMEATNTQDASEGTVWEESFVDFDIKAMFPIGPRKHIRAWAVPGDRSAYDAGRVNIAVAGVNSVAAGNVIGRIWISYTVEFHVPQDSVPSPLSTTVSMLRLTSSQTLTDLTALDLNWQIDDAATSSNFEVGNPLGAWLDAGTPWQVHLPRGAYMCILYTEFQMGAQAFPLELKSRIRDISSATVVACTRQDYPVTISPSLVMQVTHGIIHINSDSDYFYCDVYYKDSSPGSGVSVTAQAPSSTQPQCATRLYIKPV